MREFIKYKNYVYAEIKGEEKARKFGYTEDEIKRLLQEAFTIVSRYRLPGSVEKIIPSEEGLDVIYDLETPFEAFLMLVYNRKGKLLEVQVNLCGNVYTASKRKDVGGLLSAINLLTTNPIKPMKKLTPDSGEMKKEEAKEWLIYTIKNDWDSLKLDLVSRTSFIKQMQAALNNSGELPNDAGSVDLKDANAAIKAAQLLSDSEWSELVQEIKSGGSSYVPTKDLIKKAIDLVAGHEGDIVSYDTVIDDDEIMVSIPTKYRYIYLVFKRVPGNKLVPEDGMLIVCNNTVHVGSSIDKLRALVSAAVDLDLGRDRTPKARQEKTPKRPNYQESEEDIKELLKNSLVFYYNNETEEYRHKLKTNSGSSTKEEFEKGWAYNEDLQTSQWKLIMKQNNVDNALLVYRNKVYLLDSDTGKVTRELGPYPA